MRGRFLRLSDGSGFSEEKECYDGDEAEHDQRFNAKNSANDELKCDREN